MSEVLSECVLLAQAQPYQGLLALDPWKNRPSIMVHVWMLAVCAENVHKQLSPSRYSWPDDCSCTQPVPTKSSYTISLIQLHTISPAFLCHCMQETLYSTLYNKHAEFLILWFLHEIAHLLKPSSSVSTCLSFPRSCIVPIQVHPWSHTECNMS